MLLNAFVILFNFSIFLNVCIYSIYRVILEKVDYIYLQWIDKKLLLTLR